MLLFELLWLHEVHCQVLFLFLSFFILGILVLQILDSNLFAFDWHIDLRQAIRALCLIYEEVPEGELCLLV